MLDVLIWIIDQCGSEKLRVLDYYIYTHDFMSFSITQSNPSTEKIQTRFEF